MCVGTGRGCFAGRAGLFGGSRKPACAGFVFQPVCSLLTVTPGLLSCLNRLKGIYERALRGCDEVFAGTGRGCFAGRAGLFGALGSQQAPSLCSLLSIRYVRRL